MREWRVDQVLLKRAGGRVVAYVSMVGRGGGLRHERVYPPTADAAEALRSTGRRIAGLGNVELAEGVRVRWSREDALLPDAELLDAFREAFEAELEAVRDSLR